MKGMMQHFICSHCDWNQVDNAVCEKCGRVMMPAGSSVCAPAIFNASKLTDGEMAELTRRTSGDIFIARKSISYIATYQAECVDGNQVTSNLALSDVPEGATPDSIIKIITEQAQSDIARSGMNATSVLVLSLSRVW